MIMPKQALVLALSFVVLGTACKKENSNKLPVADAGPLQNIVPPVEDIVLTGSGTDADGTIVSYSWTQLSGPTTSVIADRNAPVTSLSGLEPGTYVYQLSVVDNDGGIGRDTTSVTLNEMQGAHTDTLQPNNNPNEAELILLNGKNASGVATTSSVDASYWATADGDTTLIRSLIKFDLSGIPSTASVVSAHLYLYANLTPTSGNKMDASFGYDNGLIVRQVTSDWNPAALDWFNQPTSRTDNPAIVPATWDPLDVNIDVTGQVASMVKGNANYGFIIQLLHEDLFKLRIFVSSRNTAYPGKHPKLVVSYN